MLLLLSGDITSIPTGLSAQLVTMIPCSPENVSRHGHRPLRDTQLGAEMLPRGATSCQ